MRELLCPGTAPEVAPWLKRLPLPAREPPASLLSLAKLAAVQRASKALLSRALTRSSIVPDVEGAKAACCQLCREPRAARLKDARAGRYFAALFSAAAAATGAQLSRFDLHHGHLFAHTAGLGLLLHAQEYPSNQPAFDHHLGYCQTGSPLLFDEPTFALRNLLFVLPAAGPARLAALDCSAGGLLERQLVVPDTLCRVDEADFGAWLADITYLQLPRLAPEHRVFVNS